MKIWRSIWKISKNQWVNFASWIFRFRLHFLPHFCLHWMLAALKLVQEGKKWTGLLWDFKRRSVPPLAYFRLFWEKAILSCQSKSILKCSFIRCHIPNMGTQQVCPLASLGFLGSDGHCYCFSGMGLLFGGSICSPTKIYSGVWTQLNLCFGRSLCQLRRCGP